MTSPSKPMGEGERPEPWVFAERGTFAAMYAAEAALAAAGFSVGTGQRGAPRGVMFGDYDIAKWRNLRPRDRAGLHGELTGDGREGPLTVTWRADMPADARTAALEHGRAAA